MKEEQRGELLTMETSAKLYRKKKRYPETKESHYESSIIGLMPKEYSRKDMSQLLQLKKYLKNNIN